MRLQIWGNKAKVGEYDPDHLVLQRQRTGADDGSSRYETIQVGVGWDREAPDGEKYLDIKVLGLTDNKTEYGK